MVMVMIRVMMNHSISEEWTNRWKNEWVSRQARSLELVSPVFRATQRGHVRTPVRFWHWVLLWATLALPGGSHTPRGSTWHVLGNPPQGRHLIMFLGEQVSQLDITSNYSWATCLLWGIKVNSWQLRWRICVSRPHICLLLGRVPWSLDFAEGEMITSLLLFSSNKRR